MSPGRIAVGGVLRQENLAAGLPIVLSANYTTYKVKDDSVTWLSLRDKGPFCRHVKTSLHQLCVKVDCSRQLRYGKNFTCMKTHVKLQQPARRTFYVVSIQVETVCTL